MIDGDSDSCCLHLGVCAMCAFWSLFPLFTESRLNSRADPALPYSSAARSEYENQTATAISDQEQQTSGRSYQGRTGKAINCQSLHRSTSQHPHRLYPCPQTRMYTAVHQPLRCSTHTCTDAKHYFKTRPRGDAFRGSRLSLTLRCCRFSHLHSAFLSFRCVRAAT